MAEILIHRCTLRVLRRGGWNWGPNPKRLVEDVIKIFPFLLAKKLAELLPADEDREFSAPLRIRIPVRLRDLQAEARKQASPASSYGEASTASVFETKMESALRSAFGMEITPPPAPPRPRRFRSAPADEETAIPCAAAARRGTVQRVLLAWHKHGVLEAWLAMFSVDDLESWHRALWNISGPQAESIAANAQELAAEIATLVRSRSPSLPQEDRASLLRQRIVLAAEIAARHRLPMNDASLADALRRILPVDELLVMGQAPSAQIEGEVLLLMQTIHDDIGTPPQTRALLAGTQNQSPAAAKRASPDWEVHVACALPFLLLAPLARIGYLDALAAVLEAANLSREAHFFAAALAYKVLDRPERGWRRSSQSQAAAAALAGAQDPIAEEFLVNFARQIAPHTGPLDALVADTLIRGHAYGKPLLLSGSNDERETAFLLSDAEGCFPIAWTGGVAALSAILCRLDPSLLLISRAAAGTRLLGELHTAGIHFIVDVPPTRDEPWSRIQQGTAALGWTNHASPASEPVLRAAREMKAAAEDGAAFEDSFVGTRPAVVRAASNNLDRSLTVAAGVAAGTISWELWRERGRTTPQLTLERFADLDARVRFTPSAVVVRIALGRRHRELSDAGLLAPLEDVPWLAGRRLEFSGG